MARSKPAHYRGTYQYRAKQIRQTAYADPFTRCWRCHQHLHECGPAGNGRHKTGRPARWTAGHLHDSDPNSPLLPECSPCNKSAGATYGNRLRGQRRARQKGTGATQQPTSARW